MAYIKLQTVQEPVSKSSGGDAFHQEARAGTDRIVIDCLRYVLAVGRGCFWQSGDAEPTAAGAEDEAAVLAQPGRDIITLGRTGNRTCSDRRRRGRPDRSEQLRDGPRVSLSRACPSEFDAPPGPRADACEELGPFVERAEDEAGSGLA